MMKTKFKVSKFLNEVFSSSDSIPFSRFAAAYKSDIKSMFPSKEGYDILFHPNHFELSAFITKGEKCVYMRVSDVRFFPKDWFNHILVRTAKNTKDFTGGRNTYTSLDKLQDHVLHAMSSFSTI